MRAICFDPQKIEPVYTESWDKPLPGPGEVLVRLRAAALNHRDLHITNPKNDLPFIYGSDGAGVIEQLGEAYWAGASVMKSS